LKTIDLHEFGGSGEREEESNTELAEDSRVDGDLGAVKNVLSEERAYPLGVKGAQIKNARPRRPRVILYEFDHSGSWQKINRNLGAGGLGRDKHFLA
jgi:hypothetical protein